MTQAIALGAASINFRKRRGKWGMCYEDGKTYEETCAQVRRRAGQVAEAINRHYPDATLILYYYIYQSGTTSRPSGSAP